MDEHIRRVGEFVGDALQEGARQAKAEIRDNAHRQGFTSAAGITLRRVDDELDALRNRMKGEGPKLTQTDLVFYAKLEELKTDIEAEFDQFWRGSGIDWRPRKTLVKGVVRRVPETEGVAGLD
ncbi:hypothetical protein [Leifsonia poae]|uniref:Uncharacterized protein n=1 Tax=Leifsonia poae TaxID=110933 RepID=A0A9W6H872_9MICO|nr:hypothetical protein [Leifsonia poae]GLJ75356.1 hypothetical protein GCM10017584_09300 [Leifsonia poae]